MNIAFVFQRMTDKCFKKCIGKPGSSLDNSEQVCTIATFIIIITTIVLC